ncbi:FAD:protein FMN transferase [Streptococcus catagoni]|uniref:FAD:protein FMN transferase n=1 Tax=Streptococcus catagoni TaxID=2654874 RepID=UPI00140AEBA6|nr:FAD:protein FMN transferase [Streptococcus catagoni]
MAEKIYYSKRLIQVMTIPFTLTLVSNDLMLAEQLIEPVNAKVRAELERIERDYSPFKSDSLVSRFNAGQDSILLDHPEFQATYAILARVKIETKGYFDPYYKGTYDPTGYIKGWAIESIAKQFLKPLLAHPEIVAVSLNGGGDVQCYSDPASDFSWSIAIEDPDNLQNILAIYPVTNGGLATSGFSKRGRHTKQEEGLVAKQVTIVSHSLALADIWAMVGLAANSDHFKALIHQQKLSGLCLDDQGLKLFHLGDFHND